MVKGLDPFAKSWFSELERKHGPEWVGSGGENDVTYRVCQGPGGCTVGVIALDDGKMNAISFAMLARLEAALDIAEKDETKAIVIHGNEKVFSSGFDLKTMRGGNQTLMLKLVNLGGLFSYRVFAFPKPTVLGITGHALALGAILSLAGDFRIGPKEVAGVSPPKVGLNEVAIGMSLPDFAMRLASARIPERYRTHCLSQGLVSTPNDAILYGYVDKLAEQPGYQGVVEACIREADRLGSYVKQPAFHQIKMLERGDALKAGIASINSLMAKL